MNKYLETRIRLAILDALNESLDFGDDNDNDNTVFDSGAVMREIICEKLVNGELVTPNERKIVDRFYKVYTREDLMDICASQMSAYGPQCDLNWLDVSGITDMHGLFEQQIMFNGDISRWDVSSVTNMEKMFYMAMTFAGDISKWNTRNVKTMANMFYAAFRFDCDLSKWNVSKVKDMHCMFQSTQ